MRGDVGRGMGGVGESKGRCEGCGKVSEEVWRVWGSELDVGGGEKKFGEKAWGEWEKVREMWGV